MRDEGERIIGSISLYDQPGKNRGFWLAPQWWGRGYMHEACGTRSSWKPSCDRSTNSSEAVTLASFARKRQ
ncbi:GNAT family N-acetyltransferase [Pseudomonas farsensis]|uniref:GNAT family N-acetyltransferase n=1 Tax=Pseudomonas farsensis TaxID=2745492 RepID=UPI003BB7C3F8